MLFGLATLLDEPPNRLGRHRTSLPSHFAPGFEQCEQQAAVIGFDGGHGLVNFELNRHWDPFRLDSDR